MARTTTRGAHLTDSLIIRISPEDKASIKLAANKVGLDVSNFIRQMLIREKVLSPITTDIPNF
jgi:uncharacterized protein (DUF1778 family)